jgi:hypothetical protein
VLLIFVCFAYSVPPLSVCGRVPGLSTVSGFSRAFGEGAASEDGMVGRARFVVVKALAHLAAGA